MFAKPTLRMNIEFVLTRYFPKIDNFGDLKLDTQLKTCFFFIFAESQQKLKKELQSLSNDLSNEHQEADKLKSDVEYLNTRLRKAEQDLDHAKKRKEELTADLEKTKQNLEEQK